MHRKRIGKGYSLVITLMIILSPLTSIFLWEESKSAAAESPLNPITTITGLENGNNFGWNVSWIGDVNRDGYDDIIVGAPYMDRYGGGGAWWDNSWLCRRKLTFNNSGQSEDLENFPVLVNLSSPNFDFSKAKIDGTDLRFIDSDGSTQLKYHIEDWNTTGYSYVWVNVTNIALGSSTDYIWMYYNNSAALNVQDITGTYDASYVGVWHMSEDPSDAAPQIKDSTSPSSNGTSAGTMTSSDQVTGKIDGCLDFDGSNDVINFGNPSELQITGAITLEAWFKSDYVLNDYLLAKMGLAGSRGWDLSFNDDVGIAPDGWMEFRYSTDGTTVRSEGYERVNASEWYYVVGVFNPSTYERFYLNGVLESEDTTGIPASQNDPSENVYLARYGGATTSYYNGTIDEVRISDIARSADWIKAQYLSMNNNFIIYGSEELNKIDTGTVYIFLGYPGITFNNINATNANVTIYGSNAGDLFGWSVADAGDVNNDDYDDIIIGAPGWGADRGRAYIFHGRATSSWSSAYDADTNADVILTGENEGDKFGFSVSGAGDMNNEIPSGEFYEGWSYRKKITIHSSKVEDDLTDFPVLIGITDTDLKNKAQSDGDDIFFTASDGKTKLDHEIESYISATGELIAWVRIPSLSSTVDTVFYMYYNNSDAANQENPEGVWDTDFLGVWHMSETGTGTRYDSTSNNYDGTPEYYDGDEATTGKIDGADDFDGTNDLINITGTMNPQVYNDFTIGVWLKSNVDVTVNDGYIFIHMIDEDTNPGISLGLSNDAGYEDHLVMYINDMGSNKNRYYGTSDIVDQQYHYLVGVREDGRIKLYVDGVLETVDTDDDDGETITVDSQKGPYCGNFKGISEQVDGILDELRVSSKARGAEWILTEYNNQYYTNTFYTVNDEDINPSDWSYRTPITINSSEVNGDIDGFPVLVHITDPDLANDARSDGYDIIFTDWDGKSQLNHEVELFNDTTGELIAWVRLANISSSSDTTFYMYYGNSSISSSMENPEDVWSNGYAAVYHLGETGYGTTDEYKDSTSNNYDGQGGTGNSEKVPTVISGVIENGQEFDGSDDHINVSAMNPQSYDDFTMEGWYKSTNATVSDDEYIWCHLEDYAAGPGIVVSLTDDAGETDHLRVSIYNNTQDFQAYYGTSDVVDQQYHHVVGVRENGKIKIYVDMAKEEDITDQHSGEIIDVDTLGGPIIGDLPGNYEQVDGILDEIRISYVARSWDWINTSYNNIDDPSSFLTLGYEESNINYDDIIVGTYGYNGEKGRAYVFFGGSGFTGEISAGNADVIINGTTPNDRLGWDVSRAGDVNNDGFGDVIIGAPGNNSNAGAAYIFYGNNSIPSFIDANDADRIMIGSGEEELGYSVSYVMDVNNDGYDDIIIGAPGYNFNQGRAYIFCNNGLNDIVIANTDDDTVSIYNGTSTGWEAESNLGVGVEPRCVFIGDANNDGYNDIVTADWGGDTVSIYNGTISGGWESRCTLSAPGSPWVVVVGDANNDGLNDIVLNDYDGDKVTIYNGTSNGLWDPIFQLSTEDYPRCVTIGDANNDGYNDILNVDQLDNTVSIFNGTSDGGWEPKFTLSIGNYPRWVCVEDANNDGYNDVVTANSNDDSVTIYNGTVGGNWEPICTLSVGNDPRCVFVGDANNDGYNDILASNYADDTVTIYNGTNDNGWEEKCTLGVGNGPMSVFVGDANNDGYNDILTADYWGDNTVTIYNGTSDGFWETKYTLSTGAYPHSVFVGNANNDGMGGSINANNANLILTGVSIGDKFGFSVGSAGDLNEDGFHDIIVGAPFYDDGVKTDAGAIYVFEGGASVDRTVDWSYKGEYANDHFGWSVSFAGDVNDDGLLDLFVGAPNNDDGGADAGKAYLLSPLSNEPVITGVAATPSIQNIGGYVNITCSVTAFSGVDSVWVNITLPDGKFINESLTPGVGNQWFYNNNYTIPGIYQYTIWANDTNGNWTESGIFFFEVINSLPSLSSSQVNPPVGYTDTGFNFSVIYTDLDNHAPNIITVNITGVGFYDLIEFDPSDTNYTNGKAYYYNLSGIAIGSYSFHFAANDTIGEWTETGILLFDVLESSPMISLEQVNPTTGNTDTGFNLTVTYTHPDNQPPDNITVNITGVGIYELIEVDPLDTDYSDGKDYYYNASGFGVGQHSFHFAANDTNGKWNESSILMFEVLNRGPMLSLEQVDPPTGYIETWFNFSVTYTDLDNHTLNIITGNITGVGVYDLIEVDPFDTDYSDGKEYYYNTSGFTLGQYSFHFAANDTYGNWTESIILQFEVVNRVPILSSGQVNPSVGDMDTAFNFSVIYTDLDNQAPDMITVNITGIGIYDLIALDPLDMDFTDGKTYYLNISGFSISVYSFHFAANDTQGDWVESEVMNFDVIDRVPTLLSEQVDPITGYIDTRFNFTVTYVDLDNHAPITLTLNITGIGVFDLIQVDLLDTVYTDGKGYYYYISGFIVGSYTFHFAANDTIGNWIESGILQFDVLNRPPILTLGQVDPTIGYSDTWFNFTVNYTDLDNHTPLDISLNLSGSSGGTFNLTEVDPSDTDYTDGKEYYYNTTLSSGLYSFHFAANDLLGMWAIETPEINEPDIIPKHGTLSAIDYTGEYSDEIFLNATLLDDNNNPISNENVAFYIDKNKNGIYETGEFVGAGITQVDGNVSTIYTANIAYGMYNFKVIYIGSGDHVVDDDEALLIIYAKGATLTAISDTVEEDEVVSLTAILIDIHGDPISFEQVELFIDKNKDGIYYPSESIGSTTTSAGGVALITYTVNLAPENYGIWAKYVGSGNYSVNEIEGLLTVQNVGNRPPSILEKIPDQIKPEDSLPWPLDLTPYEGDVEDSGPDLKWYITGVDTSLYSVTGMNSSDDIITFIPVPDAFGNDEVILWLWDSNGDRVSQVLWVNITPVNDQPYFKPLPPNLFVHYDNPNTEEDDPFPWDYTFYVHDIETPIEDLIITTSEPTIDSGQGYVVVDGLKVTFHYPQNMVGKSIPVVLTLSDGTDDTHTMIWVNVTSDWVPELVDMLPDIILEENTTLYNVFDLDDYFIDKDHDSLYFSTGYFHIKVNINENNTVDITALGGWTGSEFITFRAWDPIGAIAEDVIKVTVIPVNNPPVISGVPNLVVHYDYSYAFDLSPYIFDSDNQTYELTVWTSEATNFIWLQQHNNLGIVVNYPESMNGMTIPVTIYASDGMEITSQDIQISVTSDFPPELINNLPDIFFDEDTVLRNAFLLSDYFIDIDGDVLFYTNGTNFINATINENLTVDFSAPENWFGSEIVTFRATDPIGALAEDKILVVVVPVNDAPTIGSIPKQEKNEGDQWILDLSEYINDIDNDLSELVIIVNSEIGQGYVNLVGNILIFQYPKGTQEDIITVTVSDGELEASRSFIVNIKSSKQIVPTIWDLIPWFWVFLFLIGIIGGAFVFYRKRCVYLVHEAFLIHEKGLPIAHASKEEISELEDVIVSGMFTAVQNFISDAFAGKTSEDDWELDEMKFGDNKILIERSQNLFLAVIFEGNGHKLRNRVKKILRDTNGEYGAMFKDWDGEMAHLTGVTTMIANLISKKKLKFLRSKHFTDQSKGNIYEEEFEDAFIDYSDTKPTPAEDLDQFIAGVEISLLEGGVVKKFKAGELGICECPVCGKDIEEHDTKCPRCGVGFISNQDPEILHTLKQENGKIKKSSKEEEHYED
jgi:hypothetical protein